MLVLVLEAPLDIAAGEYSLAETLMLQYQALAPGNVLLHPFCQLWID